MAKLTEHDIRALDAATRRSDTYFPLPDHRGFARSVWEKRMSKFVAAGYALKRPFGFQITPEGREALAANKKD